MSIEVIAILRGIVPQQVEAVCDILIEHDITKIEVPLNSPDVFTSIELAAKKYTGVAEIGAGTVLSVEEVDRVRDCGGTFIVSPNTNREVICFTRAKDMGSYPGAMTPTEAFLAVDAGASAIKMFPSELIGPKGIKAMKAVLPPEIPVFAVGGAGPDNFQQYVDAGARGFGMGSFIFKPGCDLDYVRTASKNIQKALGELKI